MKHLLIFSKNNPLITLFSLLFITVIATTQLSSLRFDISAQSMMVESDPAWLNYQKSLETFGSDNTVILFVEDEHLLSKEKLNILKKGSVKTVPLHDCQITKH